ncbi:MAG: DUF58 domain-containing protein, partial [Actinomycetota bacterium]|nr:DUF58 domain-containing protein [Actinomycetota bacterium]
MTDRGKLMLVAAAASWVVSRTFAIDELSMAALACIALVVVGVAYTRVASARLSMRRSVRPHRLFHAGQATVTLDVRNDGRLPTAVLIVEDRVPGVLAIPSRFILAPLRPRQVHQVTYDLDGRQRGRYTIGPAVVHLRDPFGVAQRPVRFGATNDVIVYPPVWPLPPALPRTGPKGTVSDGSARPLATSGDFANIREYVRGDDLRKVHWKSTAHRGKIMIRQEEAPQDAEATIVLDTRRDAHRGSGPTSTFEEAVAVAASAAYDLSERGYRLRLVAGSVTEPAPTLPREVLLERLAVVSAQPGATLRPVWQPLAAGTAGDWMLVAVGAAPGAEDLRHMGRAGRGFALRVAVIVTARTPQP